MVIVFDLDDTLYDEIDFVKSGFWAIASTFSNTPQKLFDFMWNLFLQEGSGSIFNQLIEYFHLNATLETLITLYRTHTPNITLPEETITLLKAIKGFGSTALITDGLAQMQIQKFNSLGLSAWIDYPVFTNLYNTCKPNPLAYKMVMEHFKDEIKFVYFSDNPKKDFFAPNDLNWLTVRYKNPYGIYREIPSNASYEITSRLTLIPIIQQYLSEK
ncbi:HAD family hydrolase [Sulfuricurvum sp.]|uniref:HAD family hydrolase n=1 Tax=Sulfuricurvum sp. TaxID=2025608 RepID=UPI002629B7B3|nr:HAD family hydrolase [Sulfuricurvum sp.]MDD4882952.1 HAD family hydrolase [Sulfuricurvum sp.]